MKFLTSVLLLQAFVFLTVLRGISCRQTRPLDLFSVDSEQELNKLEELTVNLEKGSKLDENEILEEEEGFFLPEGAKFREKDTDGFICMNKNMTINDIKYDEEVRCNHVSYKNCYQAYKTVYKPQECEVCKDNFKKECFIEYEDVAKTEVVRVCASKAERKCRDINTTTPPTNETRVCTIIYQTICETKFRNYNVSDQSANCTIVSEKVKFNETNSNGKIIEIEREVPTTKCNITQNGLNKSFPETECTKQPSEVCGPEWCPVVTTESCEDKEKTFVTPVPKERCELKPYKICNVEVISLPSLQQVSECIDVPKEVCSVEQVNPRTVERIINKKWCTRNTTGSPIEPKPSVFIGNDCEDYYKRNETNYKEGIYKIRSQNGTIFNVYCIDKGYTVIQMRGPSNLSENYFSNKTWNDYKNGFGDLGTEFWMGLNKIYSLTNSKKYELRIHLTLFNGSTYDAFYDHFKLSENETFTLIANSYHGTAADALTYHNSQKFSTFDNDNDNNPNVNCAEKHKGAWWYDDCRRSNLNGIRYSSEDSTKIVDGLTWQFLSNLEDHQLKKVVMAIKENIPKGTRRADN